MKGHSEGTWEAGEAPAAWAAGAEEAEGRTRSGPRWRREESTWRSGRNPSRPWGKCLPQLRRNGKQNSRASAKGAGPTCCVLNEGSLRRDLGGGGGPGVLDRRGGGGGG